ncbi:type II secretion system F family protein [Spiribacter salinus]|uniref:type II secretion system F family protein n=1 Tax=Spiribacter salinus TaxID=1335746 RepID=UPI001C980ED1|nr:type II secretion system F family protein [Spiribacter salinus]MBY5269035.1 hypothetical protein [Spiribacter salinus]
MQRFLWRGIDQEGRPRRGIMASLDVHQLRGDLREREIALEEASALPAWLERLVTPSLPSGTAPALADLFSELATLTEAGIPLVQALEMTARAIRNGPLRRAMGTIRADVAAGTALSRALASHPQLFDPLTCAMVRAGEQASALSTLMARIAEHHARSASARQQLRRAMVYPSTILLVALVVSVTLIGLVVPRFESMFASFGAELPVLTRELIRLAGWLRGGGWLLVPALLAAIGVMAWLGIHYQPLRRLRDHTLVRMPIAGGVLRRLLTARFARTLAIMASAGVPLTEALPAIAQAMGNLAYREAVYHVGESLRDGQRLETALSRSHCFPETMARMVAIGEESGQLERMLMRIADREEAAAEQAARALTSAMEPLIMILLGLLIGGLVLAMYLPVFRLGQAL